MPPTTTATVLVVTALDREMTVRSGGPVRTAVVGIGAQAGQVLAELLQAHRPSAVLSLGFAGGLASNQRTETVMVCDWVRTPEQSDPAIEATSPFLARASNEKLTIAQLAVHTGGLLTVPTPLMNAEEKRAAGLDTGTLIVDMEGYSIANAVANHRRATASRLPLLVTRVVLDPLHQSMPKLIHRIIAKQGGHQLRDSLRAVASNPLVLGSLISLGYRFWKAKRVLRRASNELVPLLLSHAEKTR